jgi:hypothetical protein
MSLEKIILGTLIFSPRFLELTEIQDNLFSTEKKKKVFHIITRLWEEERPQEIDLTLLASRMGGDGDYSFVSSLLDGLQHLSEENFLSYVTELKKKKISERINTISQKNANYHLKHGEVDPELTLELKKLWAEFDSLEVGREPLPLVCLSEIAPVEVPWLWKNFIPLGRAAMISGDPNSGKTFFALDLAARVSKGLSWPDGASGADPANIIYLTIEDDPADTLRPRLDSLGGDPARVKVLNLNHTDFFDLSNEKGLKTLEAEIEKFGKVRLVIIDPILDFSGKINPNAAEQVRALLTPLINLAVKFSFSLLLIAHLNKAQSMAAIYRTSGATAAWLGKCRASFLIFRDREDPGKRYFIPLKANLSPEDPPQLCFRLLNGQVLFERLEERIDAEEHIGAQRERIESDSSFVSNWLKEVLGDGPIELKEIFRQSKDFDIPRASLFRKKKALGIQSKISGVGKLRKAVWFLPGKEK